MFTVNSWICCHFAAISAALITAKVAPNELGARQLLKDLWEVGAETWAAVGTLFLAAATFALVAIGIRQLSGINAEKIERTLAICHRYDVDPVLDVCLRRLWVLRQTKRKSAKVFKKYFPDIASLLNYLDSIAVGIEQGIYIEGIVRGHIEVIVMKHVKEFLIGPNSKLTGMDTNNYKALIRIYERWSDL